MTLQGYHLCWIALFILTALTITWKSKHDGSAQHRRMTTLSTTTTSVLCRMSHVEIYFAAAANGTVFPKTTPTHSRRQVCFLPDKDTGVDLAYDVHLPEDAMLLDQEEQVRLQGVQVDYENAEIVLSGDTTVESVPSDSKERDKENFNGRRRRLTPVKVGQSTVLVLRVKYLGVEPTLNRDQLAGYIFGLGNLAVSVDMAHQYRACSSDNFRLVPADDDRRIRLGVANIR